MTPEEFKRIRKQIEKLLKQAEQEQLEKGVDISSPEFLEIMKLLKSKLLEKHGLTIEDYNSLVKMTSAEIDNIDQEGLLELFAKAEDRIRGVEKMVGPMGPQGLSGPQGPKGKDGRDGKDGNDGKQGEIGRDGKDGSVGPKGDTGKSVNKKEVDDIVSKRFSAPLFNKELNGRIEKKAQEAIIEPIRRLAMGLDQKIDSVSSSLNSYILGDGVVKITVGTVEPSSPTIGNLWVDTT